MRQRSSLSDSTDRGNPQCEIKRRYHFRDNEHQLFEEINELSCCQSFRDGVNLPYVGGNHNFKEDQSLSCEGRQAVMCCDGFRDEGHLKSGERTQVSSRDSFRESENLRSGVGNRGSSCNVFRDNEHQRCEEGNQFICFDGFQNRKYEVKQLGNCNAFGDHKTLQNGECLQISCYLGFTEDEIFPYGLDKLSSCHSFNKAGSLRCEDGERFSCGHRFVESENLRYIEENQFSSCDGIINSETFRSAEEKHLSEIDDSSSEDSFLDAQDNPETPAQAFLNSLRESNEPASTASKSPSKRKSSLDANVSSKRTRPPSFVRTCSSSVKISSPTYPTCSTKVPNASITGNAASEANMVRTQSFRSTSNGHNGSTRHDSSTPERILTSLGYQLLGAAREGRITDILKLLKRGADINFPNRSKWTALHMASRKAYADIVSLLLENGANPNSRTSYHCTALHLAAYNDFSGRCVDLLARAGGQVNTRNAFGRTPLHLAAECGNELAVFHLMLHDASTTIRNDEGKRPLDLAKSENVRSLLVI